MACDGGQVPLLVCVLDAFRVDAVPTLAQVLNREPAATGCVIPPFSFEPDAAFLCGRYPEETDSGTHFWYRPEASPFRRLSRWGPVADRLPHLFQLSLRHWLRWNARGRARRITTARIPFSFLPFFDVVRQHGPLDGRFCVFPTLFDLLRAGGKRFLYLGAPVSSASSQDVWRDFQRASLDRVDLVFLFVGDLDGIGHRYGPNSPEYRDAVWGMGHFIRQVQGRIEKEQGDVSCLVFGDHGMVEVQRLVDVHSTLEGLPVRPFSDYLYFLDSTLARFWFFNDRARQIVTQAMEAVRGGRLLTDEDREVYRIRYPHNRFGELIWWADGGALISPNFWQDQKLVRGMHGYRREIRENQAGFVLIDPELDLWGIQLLKAPLEMVDAFATMIELLGLEMPDNAHGRSIFRQIGDAN